MWVAFEIGFETQRKIGMQVDVTEAASLPAALADASGMLVMCGHLLYFITNSEL
jgi:lauroyl/myristoyl acyltransferase